MSLVRCHSCNKKISNAATSCPGCGEPRPGAGWPKPKLSLGWGIFIIVAGLIYLFNSDGSKSINSTSKHASSDKKSPRESVVNSPLDGSVWQAAWYIKKRLKDPESFEAIEWSPVVKLQNGYRVRCQYRAKNSFGGYVVEQVLVDFNKEGDVVGLAALN